VSPSPGGCTAALTARFRLWRGARGGPGLCSSSAGLEALARLLDALSHPLRLRIVALLWARGELYLAEIASELGVSRALAKVHLKKLEAAGIVESRVVVEEGRAVARRFYRLSWRGEVCVSPERIARLAGVAGGGGGEA